MITKETALECLEDMDDYARMANIEPIGPYTTLKEYIEQTDKIVEAFKLAIDMGISIEFHDCADDTPQVTTSWLDITTTMCNYPEAVKQTVACINATAKKVQDALELARNETFN